MSRFLKISLSIILIILGIFLVIYGFLLSFVRVPPDKNPPIIVFEIEKSLSNVIFPDADKASKSNLQQKSSSSNSTPRAIFTLQIPAINLKETVYEGVTRRVLMSGPGHIPGTAMPGEDGNCCVSGHRVTFGGPFRELNKLRTGDRIIIHYRGKKYAYKVVWKKRVLPHENYVLMRTEKPSLTITTCDPPFSAKYRLVVRAELSR